MSAIPDQTSVPQPLQLSWEAPKVSLSPEEQDRFIKEAQRVFLASQNGLAFERFWRQLAEEFLPAIRQWCQEHHDHVEACYVTFATDHLKVFIVRCSDRYDFTLGDDLTAIEMDLFDKHWPADIIQVPRGHLESFFNPAASIQIYGNRG